MAQDGVSGYLKDKKKVKKKLDEASNPKPKKKKRKPQASAKPKRKKPAAKRRKA